MGPCSTNLLLTPLY
uniref:Uncharacterized protein n=1 Tax=Anguilla anguilla TaxID=7936 RepID=A0A0E9XZW1_ANGAN